MIFDKEKMVRVLKLATPHLVKRAKRNNQLFQCEAPKWDTQDIPSLPFHFLTFTDFKAIDALLIRFLLHLLTYFRTPHRLTVNDSFSESL